jgi:AbrB family looped-hinge helix DNA binding protein
MTTLQAKVTSKGQITLPKQLRTKLAIRSGDRLEFEMDKPDRISVRKKRAPGSSAGCGRRFIRRKKKAVTVEDMDAGIRKAISQKYKSSLSEK